MHVSRLFLYPVKSLRGFAVEAADLDALGFVGDRRFLLVDAQNQFLTQRALPRMALIETALTARDLILRAPHTGSCAVPLRAAAPPELLSVRIWKSEGLLAEDCGVEVAVWLSDFLRFPCKLVRAGEKFHRPNLKAKAQPGDVFNFADSCPFMVLSEASLADLNDRLDEPLPVDRFRPSFVVQGCDAYAEDSWPRFRIGAVTFPLRRPVLALRHHDDQPGSAPSAARNRSARSRCIAADADDPTDVNFGQNVIHETKSGTDPRR
jgi:uncharacterized protein YcbX